MWKLLLITATLLLSTVVYGQKNSSVELDIVGRYDKHADYTTRFGNRSYTNDTKLWGKSFGFSFNYNRSLHKYLNGKVGIGYYNLGINKIRQTTPFNTIVTGRNIDYQHPSGIQPLFATTKYHYDNLSFTLGLAYNKPIAKKVDLLIGGDFNYLYTFSQLIV
jgi:outer membrane protein assembly factor BamA